MTDHELKSRLADTTLLREHGFIDGEWALAESGSNFDVRNPATGELVTELPRMAEAETRRAIDAAHRALPQWRDQPAVQRRAALLAWAALVRDNADDIATILVTEQGKPYAEARGEVLYAADFLTWFGEEARRVYGDVFGATADTRVVVLKRGVGVVAGITPWNLPAVMITRKAAPALAAGCAMVLKPAEQTPLTALALCELAVRAGIPRGILNVVTASGEDAPAVGRVLTGDPRVRKISFTGSTAVGKLLMRQAADHMQRVSMELGGNAAFLVFEDADLSAAVEGIVASKFRNAGQLCTAANRILVHQSVAGKFVDLLAARVASLRVGSGFGKGVDIGPLIDEPALAKVEHHMANLQETGAKVLVGGRRHELGRTFYEPSVLTGLTEESDVWKEETFGPIAAVATFTDEREAISRANDTQYGLVNYLYTHQLGRVWRVSEQLDSGMVAVNAGRVSNEMAPFGGIKDSGMGREGSKYGLDDWLDLKYINLGGLGR